MLGAKPADLRVERASKFDFVVNLKTPNALGLTIRPTIPIDEFTYANETHKDCVSQSRGFSKRLTAAFGAELPIASRTTFGRKCPISAIADAVMFVPGGRLWVIRYN
jgi:hypothetical protein